MNMSFHTKKRRKTSIVFPVLLIGAIACVMTTMMAISVTMVVDDSVLRMDAFSSTEAIYGKSNASPDVESNNQQQGGIHTKDSKPDESLSLEERYLKKWQPPNIQHYIQVFENHLPPESLHQEGGSCIIDSKIYIIGGSNGTIHDYEYEMSEGSSREAAMMNQIKNSLGGQVVTIYDMKDMSSTFGPRFPYPANHIVCAKAPDGVTIHLTGGFNQAAEDKNEASFSHHYTLDTSKEDAKWELKPAMPFRRGAHGCDFMADGRMYCVGGGVSQWGPFKNDLMIYDPSDDSWQTGPPMPTPRDHLYETVIAIHNGKKLYVPGGRTSIQNNIHAKNSHPLLFANTNVVEIYDLETNQWNRAKDILAERAAIAVLPYKRNVIRSEADKEKKLHREPNLLLVGGEKFYGSSGKAETIIDEYDTVNDLYYCLEKLPWPYYGGGLGVYNDTMHVVGGSEWIGHSATRRVMLYDLKGAPPPRQCFYDPVPVFDQWDRTWNKSKPWQFMLLEKEE